MRSFSTVRGGAPGHSTRWSLQWASPKTHLLKSYGLPGRYTALFCRVSFECLCSAMTVTPTPTRLQYSTRRGMYERKTNRV